jgi:translation elongation factor EF-1beta
MVGATKPSDAAPGSIRGDLCVDVGRNLIHASDSSESAAHEVAMWFPDCEIVNWRPCSLEWTYEDEEVPQDSQVDGIAALAGGASGDLVKRLADLELENKNLKQVTNDLKAMVLKLEGRVVALEKKGGSAPAAAPGKPAPKAAPAADDEDDDDVDLFGSDSESDNDEEKNKVREERLAAYHAKKSKKPAVIAKTSVVLDIKPWDDETDMDAMLKQVKTITKEGLVWGASKLVPVGYGINKLRIMLVVEDDKVSIDELQEQISEFEDFVQSVDVDSMQKI